jgi:hypothetical protein
MRTAFLAALLALALHAAEQPAPLLTEAAKGRTAEIKALLDHGADIEAIDRDGRTALMLAAKHGRLETVRLLLARGAKTDIRDRDGDTAYMLAVFAPSGRGDHEGVLKALPQPRRPRLNFDVSVSRGNLASSCFQTREQLAQTVDALRLDNLFAREFTEYVRASGRGLVDLTGDNPDVAAKIDIQPGAACEAQLGDTLTFRIAVTVIRAADGKTVFDKNFGGGIKGLRAQSVHNAEQYAPVFDGWTREQPGPIYWAVAEEAYRYTPQQ